MFLNILFDWRGIVSSPNTDLTYKYNEERCMRAIEVRIYYLKDNSSTCLSTISCPYLRFHHVIDRDLSFGVLPRILKAT